MDLGKVDNVELNVPLICRRTDHGRAGSGAARYVFPDDLHARSTRVKLVNVALSACSRWRGAYEGLRLPHVKPVRLFERPGGC